MANEEHLKILRQGVEVWNKWRDDNPYIKPDLSEKSLIGAQLNDANLSIVDFSYANLRDAKLGRANLSEADLSHADLYYANLSYADLNYADLSHTNLSHADLTHALLCDALLLEALIDSSSINGAHLSGANFAGAVLSGVSFLDVDLSLAVNLDKALYVGPSWIGIDTLYKSGGKIPVEFLRGCGIPDDFITFIPSHFGIQEAIQFYSCFISYSTKDEEFARRLYSRMRDEKLRVWFAPEDMKGGKLLHEQIEQAIQLHDRLLVVLSDESMASEWVKREIRNARRAEKKEGRRKLFPIRLVDYEAIQDWKGFDGDGGENLAF